MKRMTKKTVDELAILEENFKDLKKQAAAAEKLYKIALAPVVAYVDSKVTADQGMELRGAEHIINIGAQRVVRVLVDPVEALLRLEKVEKCLGYANIKLAVKIITDNLRESDTVDLFSAERGARSVKVIDIE